MNVSAAAVVRQEFRAARRERLPQLMLVVFLGLVAAATFIGWLTHTTVTSVYTEALREGATNQPNPFLLVPPLSAVKNIVIYVSLIGALLAILVGVQSAIRDRKAKVLGMVFSRPIGRRLYIAAKFAGVMLLLGLTLCAAAVLTWFSLWIIGGQPLNWVLTGHLILYFVVSWAFLIPFAALGMMSGLYSQRETTALLVPILIWVLFTFILPQLGTAAEPISFLNPVPAQISSSGPFFAFNHQFLQPLSYIDHYKELSASTLAYTHDTAILQQELEVGSFVVLSTTALLYFAPRLIRQGSLYE